MIGEMNLKPEEVFLAQGTLRPDLIESASHLASGKADVIKTHHNDTELIRKLRDEVLHRPFVHIHSRVDALLSTSYYVILHLPVLNKYSLAASRIVPHSLPAANLIPL